jgi:hypothetical protein
MDQTRRWRRLVAKDRILPSSTGEGCRFLIHLTLPKAYILTCFKKYRIKYAATQIPSLPPPCNILAETLQAARCPTYMQHLEKYGPDRGDKTAEKIKNKIQQAAPPLRK